MSIAQTRSKRTPASATKQGPGPDYAELIRAVNEKKPKRFCELLAPLGIKPKKHTNDGLAEELKVCIKEGGQRKQHVDQLVRAALNIDTEQAVDFLALLPDDFMREAGFGENLLMLAVEHGNLNVIEFLIANKLYPVFELDWILDELTVSPACTERLARDYDATPSAALNLFKADLLEMCHEQVARFPEGRTFTFDQLKATTGLPLENGKAAPQPLKDKSYDMRRPFRFITAVIECGGRLATEEDASKLYEYVLGVKMLQSKVYDSRKMPSWEYSPLRLDPMPWRIAQLYVVSALLRHGYAIPRKLGLPVFMDYFQDMWCPSVNYYVSGFRYFNPASFATDRDYRYFRLQFFRHLLFPEKLKQWLLTLTPWKNSALLDTEKEKMEEGYPREVDALIEYLKGPENDRRAILTALLHVPMDHGVKDPDAPLTFSDIPRDVQRTILELADVTVTQLRDPDVRLRALLAECTSSDKGSGRWEESEADMWFNSIKKCRIRKSTAMQVEANGGQHGFRGYEGVVCMDLPAGAGPFHKHIPICWLVEDPVAMPELDPDTEELRREEETESLLHIFDDDLDGHLCWVEMEGKPSIHYYPPGTADNEEGEPAGPMESSEEDE